MGQNHVPIMIPSKLKHNSLNTSLPAPPASSSLPAAPTLPILIPPDHNSKTTMTTTATTTAAAAASISHALEPNHLFSVQGIVAVITGGGTGIGLMMATALENNGATVYIVGRRLSVLEKAARERSRYGRMIPLQGDVTSRESLQAVVKAVHTRSGYVNVLVNNAGIARGMLPPTLNQTGPKSSGAAGSESIGALRDVLWNSASPQDFREVYEANVVGTYYATVAFLELLHLGNLSHTHRHPHVHVHSSVGEPGSAAAGSRSGSQTPVPILVQVQEQEQEQEQEVQLLEPPAVTSQVITLSSVAAFRRDERQYSIPYTLSKVANMHMGKIFANMLRDWKIRSNIIAPGIFPSEMTAWAIPDSHAAHDVPLQRVGNIEDIAGLILFLSSRAGSYVDGVVHIIDGGRLTMFSSTY